ncbi:Chromosome partition protein Smc [Corynebacterium occultum]|uniref:Chromosome partition protein Smc n=1 Tax=Corynebacterium occultum TaxID=2675219 RepID=A0A6B8VNR5_9CORY|nr:ATP-binding protein [Corynebacterium occultum]QGU07192.1 Chromosome partition protein Smc [Corynebacterium occultum]
MSRTIPGQFRLSTLQVCNWGTFDGVTRFDIAEDGFLIYGPSGSGKSTLIDAVSAVLVHAQKRRFNAAADKDNAGGRNLVSYCRGAWANEESTEFNEITQSYLREGPTWSGISLTYRDGLGSTVNVVYLMFLRASAHSDADIKRLFITLPEEVDIENFESLAKNGLDVGTAKRLFPQAYCIEHRQKQFLIDFSNRIGVADLGAWELLHQAQSTKNLGDLNSMIREFMLTEPATFHAAKTAVDNFTELETAYQAVLNARRQIECLIPIREADEQRREIRNVVAEVQEQIDALPRFMSDAKEQYLEEEIAALNQELLAQDNKKRIQQATVDRIRSTITGLERALDGNENEAIRAAKTEVANLKDQLHTVEDNARNFNDRVTSLGKQLPATESEFLALRSTLAEKLDEFTAARDLADERRIQISTNLQSTRPKLQQVIAELQSAQKNRSSMDHDKLVVKARICEATGIPARELPFVADLIAVREEEKERWQPVAERTMFSFARDMLVPEEHYKQVSQFVNSEHLGTRLQYIQITKDDEYSASVPFTRNSLASKFEVKETRFRAFLEYRLSSRFDHLCAVTMDQFHEARRAVTEEGQIKDGANHTKDDRFDIRDNRKWVLSGNVEFKIEHLTKHVGELREELAGLEANDAELKKQIADYDHRCTVMERLLETTAFADIDVPTRNLGLHRAQNHLDQLESKDTKREQLKAELRNEQKKLEAEASILENVSRRIHVDEAKVEQLNRQLEVVVLEVGAQPDVDEVVRAKLRKRSQPLVESITSDNVERVHREVSARLVEERSKLRGTESSLNNAIINTMEKYLNEWRHRRSDLRVNAEWARDFVAELDNLEAENLPKYEDKFHQKLHDDTIQPLSQLYSDIRSATSATRNSIANINQTLNEVEFYPGVNLQIEVKEDRPKIATDFIEKLKNTIEGSLIPGDLAMSEDRFKQMRELIHELTVSDTNPRRVRDMRIDTRRHVRFHGVEIKHDGTRGHVYESSRGLSGGQAQKLSSFCLAAALKYRLCGMGMSEIRSRNAMIQHEGSTYSKFGTIILDEAFDRADATFTRAALDAFTEFGFHMIMATPEKLLQTVQSYIGGVLLVECPDRKYSLCSQLTIEEAQEHEEL